MVSIAAQTTEHSGGVSSVLARQRHDHVALDELLEQVVRTTGAEQDEALTRLWRLVFRHAYAEETILWPAVRSALPDGEALTLKVERKHQEINELAAAIDWRSGTGPGRDEMLSRFVALLQQDVRDEEDVLLPRLQEALDPRRLRRLGVAWEVVRRTAPTRPHAVVSRRPPGNVLAALPLGLIDHGRDDLDRAARTSSVPVRTGATALSRVLAGAAGAVEHLPLLRHGEQPDTQAPQTAVEA